MPRSSYVSGDERSRLWIPIVCLVFLALAVFVATRIWDPGHVLDLALLAEYTEEGDGKAIRLRHEPPYLLPVKSGRISLVDPDGPTPFSIEGSAGQELYRVLLSVKETWRGGAPETAGARMESEDLAFLTLQVTQETPVSWKRAGIVGANQPKGAGEPISFAGGELVVLNESCLKAFLDRDEEAFAREVEAEMAQEPGREWNWAAAKTDQETGCVVCTLRVGTTSCRPYLGLAKDGSVACMTLDFGLMDPDAR
jgi:hypothetical protein